MSEPIDPHGVNDSPVGKKRYEGEEIAITRWDFSREGKQFQISLKGGEREKRQGNGYFVVSMRGAAELWRELGQALKDVGVIA